MRRWLNLHRLFVAILLVGLFAMAVRPVTDPDVWWHLKTGQLIWQNHRVPRSDPFSFTRAGQPWVNHEWLSDWIFFGIYQVWGLIGLDLVFAAVLSAVMFIVFLRSPGRPFLAGLFVVWGAIASAPSWGARPQMLSLLLASLFLWLLERSDGIPGVAWLMVPLTLLWVNLHAGYVLGIVFIALYTSGLLLEVAFKRQSWADNRRQIRTLTAVMAACCCVVPLNPNGSKLYSYPFVTLQSRSMQAYIAEWFSPNFHAAKYLPFLFMLLALFCLLLISPRRLRWPQILLLIATTWAALQAVRHIPVFVLVAGPILAALFEPLFASRRLQTRRLDSLSAQLLNAVAFCALLVFGVVRVRTVTASLPRVETENFPAAAVQFLESNQIAGPLLNHYNWGGYLIWKSYPKTRVFIDGRADLYGDDFMNQFADLYYVKDPDWYARIEHWNIRSVMLPPDAPLVSALLLKGGWVARYRDGIATVLVRDSTSASGAAP